MKIVSTRMIANAVSELGEMVSHFVESIDSVSGESKNQLDGSISALTCTLLQLLEISGILRHGDLEECAMLDHTSRGMVCRGRESEIVVEVLLRSNLGVGITQEAIVESLRASKHYSESEVGKWVVSYRPELDVPATEPAKDEG